jgi:hypothetical protein
MKNTIFFKAILGMMLAFAVLSCKKDETTPVDKTDDVVEIAIRQVKTGQTNAFTGARTNFINLLTKETGVSNDREYKSFFHYNPAQDQSREVYVGMTQYENLATFQAAGQKLGTSAEAGAFFSTFDALTYTVLKPAKVGTVVDLTKVASSGQVLEIAVRDFSKYPNFNKADYEAKRDAFLAELAKQPARVAEFQWVSALDPNIAIGMTVYTNQQAFLQLANDATFANNPAVGAFLGTYPPTNYGEVCTVVK